MSALSDESKLIAVIQALHDGYFLNNRGRINTETLSHMCNLYSITTNQAAIINLFRVINRYVGNLPPMPGVFPDYPAPVILNTDAGTEMVTMRWGMPPRPRTGGAPVTAALWTT